MAQRVTQVATEILAKPASNVRVTQVATEILLQPTTLNARVSQVVVEILINPPSLNPPTTILVPQLTARLSNTGTFQIANNIVFNEISTQISVPSGIVTNGLIAYLNAGNTSSYSGTGNTWTDLSGQGANATMQGSVSFVNNGTQSYFNWSTQNDANYFSSSLTQGYRDMSILFYPTDTTTSAFYTLLNTGYLNDNSSIRYGSSSSATGGGAVSGQVPNAGNGSDYASSATTFYLNGVANTSHVTLNVNQWQVLGGHSTNGSMTGGNWQYYVGSPSYSGRGYQGRVAAVLLYNRTLSAAEQLQNYQALGQQIGLISTTPVAGVLQKRTYLSSTVFTANLLDEVTRPANVKMRFANTGIVYVGQQFDEVNLPSVTSSSATLVSSGLALNLDASSTTSYSGSGTTWADLSGNGYNFTLQNASSYNNSGVKYMDFNGTYGAATIASGTDIPVTGDVTAIVWTRVKNSTSDWRTLFRSQTTGSNHGVIVESGSNKLGMYNGGFYDSGFTVDNLPGYGTTTWVMMTWRFKASTTPYYSFSYNDSPSIVRGSNSSAATAFATGIYALGFYQGGGQYWGDLAQVLLYNRVLTDAEVLQNFNATRSRFGL